MKKRGFTLIELLAVIVVLAIILAIAIPSISNIINSSKESAFESDAKMVLKAAEYAKLANESFDPTTITKENMQEKIGVSSDNYSYVEFKTIGKELTVTLVGRSKWDGLISYGTMKNMAVKSSDYTFAITILKDNPAYVLKGYSYTEAGATATSPFDENISVSSTNDIDINTAGTYYVTYTATDSIGKTATAKREVIVTSSIDSGSIIDSVDKYSLPDGNYDIIANGETYPIELITIDGDITYSTGIVSLGSATADQRMVVAKYNGNLTIDSGVMVIAATRKKGMLIYVEGTLTNNGRISMTNRGAIAAGQNVYLWKNADGTYEYVPAVGASGGASVSIAYGGGWSINGKTGSAGSSRKTGGGGSGAAYANSVWSSAARANSGAGGAGTSYSGGAGGGAATAVEKTINGAAGSSTGGAGGRGYADYGGGYYAGGGAGNPGGLSANGTTTTAAIAQQTGTGGLLIVYANDLINNGIIESKGKSGAASTENNPGISSTIGGGSSGGGSINLFYKTSLTSGTVSAAGGSSVGGGGVGGAGSITSTQILNQ
jgi:prepilin-type N-terminal cleavage/methylation domain-containing protein